MQNPAELAGRIEPDVSDRLVKAGDGPAVHLRMLAVTAVDPHDRCLVAVATGVVGRPAQSLGPVGSQPLIVVGTEAMTERVAYDLVRHYPRVPRVG